MRLAMREEYRLLLTTPNGPYDTEERPIRNEAHAREVAAEVKDRVYPTGATGRVQRREIPEWEDWTP